MIPICPRPAWQGPSISPPISLRRLASPITSSRRRRSKHSDRPLETAEPLARAVGVTVQHDIRDKDFEDLVDEIFSDPAYRGKTVVICWHHGTLPAIAALLGAPAGSYPDPWPDDTYNVILDFRYDPNSGSPPAVTQVTEPF